VGGGVSPFTNWPEHEADHLSPPMQRCAMRGTLKQEQISFDLKKILDQN